MAFHVYHLYMCTATVSALTSLVMIIILYQKTKKLRTNLISQALMLYGFFDIVGACSWYLDNKYSTSYEICSMQEYIFQASNLFKALTTVLISCLACYVVKELKSPQLSPFYLKVVCLLYLLPLCFLALSVYFKSSSPFCGTSDKDKSNIAYTVVFLPPLYICVGINFVMYGVIKSRAKKIVHFFSVIYQTSVASVDAQLLIIVNKLRIYPNVFCFCWLPEVVYIFILISAGTRWKVLGIVSGVCINSSGTLVAACYLYQQYYKHQTPATPATTTTTEPVVDGTDNTYRGEGEEGGGGGGRRRGQLESMFSVTDTDSSVAGSSSQSSSQHSSTQNPLVISSLLTETLLDTTTTTTAATSAATTANDTQV